MSTTENANLRFIMVIETSNYINRLEANQFNLFTQKLHNSLLKSLNHFNGRIVLKNDNVYVVNFKSVSNVILCALKIQSNFKYITPKFDNTIRQLKIGIASGYKKNIDQIIKDATRICEVIKDQIVISEDVKTHYESVNKNSFINKEHIKVLKNEDLKFINQIIDLSESSWQNSSFSVNDFSSSLPYSKAQVYRKIKLLTGKSPSTFLREFRLIKAMNLLHENHGNISDIATESGFNSPTYFSKSFKSKFGILPSKYTLQHVK